MPKLNGMELIEKIRKIRKDIPVILFSGYSNIKSQEIELSKGVNVFLMKPLLKSEIAKSIRNALDNQDINDIE